MLIRCCACSSLEDWIKACSSDSIQESLNILVRVGDCASELFNVFTHLMQCLMLELNQGGVDLRCFLMVEIKCYNPWKKTDLKEDQAELTSLRKTQSLN